MPTEREREYYRMGYADGLKDCEQPTGQKMRATYGLGEFGPQGGRLTYTDITKPKKRKLSAWNKYVKANSKKPRFRYRNGKLNLKKMAVAFRKTKKRGGR
jgi:hypothetical protein